MLFKQALIGFRQYGTRESKEITIEGRVQFDLLQVLLRVLWESKLDHFLQLLTNTSNEI